MQLVLGRWWYRHLVLALFLLLLQRARTGSASASGNETDRAALLAFKRAISGSGHADPLGSWNDSLPFCKWRGVSCHAGRATALLLPSVGLAGAIPPAIGNLTFLTALQLPDNALTGAIPPSIGGMQRLRLLDLSGNQLGGVIPSEAALLTNMTHLDLSRNLLIGPIPPELGRLGGALVNLNLSKNQLTGSIPPSLATLSSLQSIHLSNNNLTGSIPPLFANLTGLLGFAFSFNNLHGRLPDEIGQSRSLQYIVAGANDLVGDLPASIYNVTSIRMIELSYNWISGRLHRDIGDLLPELYFLSMPDNELVGEIPASLTNASAMQCINLGLNNLVGVVPADLGKLSELASLTLSYNMLQASTPREWRFMDAVTNCSKLEVLDMSRSDLSGKLPASVANLSRELRWLDLTYNRISGTIPSGIGSLAGLTALRFGLNSFSGAIPESVGLLSDLFHMQVYGNQLTGRIPSSLGNLTRMTLLELSENKLVGEVPPSLASCRSLAYLSVGGNRLTGTIPAQVLTISAMSNVINMSNNFLSGEVPMEIGHLRNLLIMDLSNNRLTGAIPSTIGKCQMLRTLYLHGNLLSGGLSPSSFGDLKGLEELDMSRNNLSGEFPRVLQDLRYLRLLNLSFNRLAGEVPVNGVFANASSVQLTGNGHLCGGIRELRLPPCAGEAATTDRSLAVKLAVSIASACIALLAAIVLWVSLVKCRAERALPKVATPPLEELHPKVSYAELSSATNRFSPGNLVGAGSHGSVYRGTMFHDGSERDVAVKVLSLGQRGALATFAAECEALRHARHRNLARILTVCASVDHKGEEFKALVYAYMPNGSLERWLHPEPSGGGRRTMTLMQRLNAALDVASALDYLHNDCEVPIAHRDLKPSNVLLDNDMVAIVGDLGLARLLDTAAKSGGSKSGSMILNGSIGYIAPEYGMGGQACASGDVYSYGILLLEMFTGRRPTNSMLPEGVTLSQFVEEADYGPGILSVVDPTLLGDVGGETIGDSRRIERPWDLQGLAVERCLISMMRIGLSCANELPVKRPGMKEVANEITKARTSLSDCHGLRPSQVVERG